MYPAKNLKAMKTFQTGRIIYGTLSMKVSTLAILSMLHITPGLTAMPASNSGGSHHAAMVVYQSVRDKLEYKREAVIEQR